MSDRQLAEVVTPQTPLASVVSGIITLASSVLALVLMVQFWIGKDIVWGSCLLLFIAVSTLFNLALVVHTREGFLAAIMSIIQLKPALDTFQSVVSYQQGTARQKKQAKDDRARRFMHSVIQSLPVTFILSYVAMVDLDHRIDIWLLVAALAFSLLSFSLGTTRFAAGSDSFLMNLVVLIHVLAQFTMRLLAVCCVCVRFKQWGMLTQFVSWVIAFVWGPQGTFPLLVERCLPFPDCKAFWRPFFLKVFLTPLSFFIVIRAVYASPENKYQPVHSYHCFGSRFIWWRMLENVAMILCFLFLPSWMELRPADEYQTILRDHLVVLGTLGFCLVFVVSTWFAIRQSDPHRVTPQPGYQPQL
eukprot:c9871_g1_i1.p1 GENE.c9871_g1_i1~~c9871_g1_i1.p1  ORF type:complete len:385 (-),score=54.48 c9871_g1_i1:1298-2374(-)